MICALLKILGRVLPVLHRRLGAPVCCHWLSERTAGLPHFLCCLVCTHKCTPTWRRRNKNRRMAVLWHAHALYLKMFLFFCPVSSVLSCPPFTSSLPLKFPFSSAGGKLTLHHRPHPYKLHTSQASLFLLPCHSHLCLSLSVCLPAFRGRPSISQGSILLLSPNRISLPCCQTGFNEMPIIPSCFKNLSLGSGCDTRPSGPWEILEGQHLQLHNNQITPHTC